MKRSLVKLTIAAMLVAVAVLVVESRSQKDDAGDWNGDWNSAKEKTSSGVLAGIDMDDATFTLEYIDWCAAADGNDDEGVVVFGVKDAAMLARMKREVPVGTRITVEHERVDGLISDAGQIKCSDYYVSEIRGDWRAGGPFVSVGTLVAVDLERGTFSVADVDWTARADGNDVDGLVVFGVRDGGQLEPLMQDGTIGGRILVEHNRLEGAISDDGQIECSNYHLFSSD